MDFITYFLSSNGINVHDNYADYLSACDSHFKAQSATDTFFFSVIKKLNYNLAQDRLKLTQFPLRRLQQLIHDFDLSSDTANLVFILEAIAGVNERNAACAIIKLCNDIPVWQMFAFIEAALSECKFKSSFNFYCNFLAQMFDKLENRQNTISISLDLFDLANTLLKGLIDFGFYQHNDVPRDICVSLAHCARYNRYGNMRSVYEIISLYYPGSVFLDKVRKYRRNVPQEFISLMLEIVGGDHDEKEYSDADEKKPLIVVPQAVRRKKSFFKRK